MLRRLVFLLSISALTPLCHAANLFADGVRKTEALPPEEEQKKFKLPPGFEMQLVANEPQINKPINMQFDNKGRLWVSSTIEYPWPVKDPNAKTRDRIVILEDFDANGHARKATTFADNLNIPIGVYPYKNGVIAYSIPNVWYLQDTDGDGICDKREILAGPFDFSRDTHGMISALRRGYDGYLYGNHGFNNHSTPKGTDGSGLDMTSGNTWRMRTDGSKMEQYSWGQVNPFGMVIDPLGNHYTADCHSMPIYQVLRGAYYPSFGRPDDGLGFGPKMMTHSHGSTAIGGIVYFADDRFPADFQSNMIVGNVMTSRVNRDLLVDSGSTRIAKELTDLVESEDPWFRPVDLQLGPDGAIYIADFYNRIIGHYEVPLTHPGRDRERGRIWRIVYKGEKGDVKLEMPKIAGASADELIQLFDHPNHTSRLLALTELTDRVGAPAVDAVKAALKDAKPRRRAIALWALFRLGALDDAMLEAATADADAMVRVHAFTAISERPQVTAAQRTAIAKGLSEADAFVRRAAADAAGQHPSIETAKPLIDALSVTPAEDTHLQHVQRMALRNHVKNDQAGPLMIAQLTDEKSRRALGEVALGAPSETGARLVLQNLETANLQGDALIRAVRHVVRYAPQGELAALIDKLKARGGDGATQFNLLKGVGDGFSQRGVPAPDNFKSWARDAVLAVLDVKEQQPTTWIGLALDGQNSGKAWPAQSRPAADGGNFTYFSSFLLGEPYTGIYRSPAFAAPKTLSFYVCGHNGEPNAKVELKNLIRLRDAASNEVLAEAPPPRNDTAQKVTWDLAKADGKQVFVELVDGDSGSAYAWLAAGRFEPAVVPLPASDAVQNTAMKPALELAQALQIAEAAPAAVKALGQRSLPQDVRIAAAKTALALDAKTHAKAVAAVLVQADEPAGLRDPLALALGGLDVAEARTALLDALRTAPARQQLKLAQALISTKPGAESLLDAAEKGTASRQLLADENLRKRIVDAKADRAEERLAVLTKGLKAPDSEVQKLIDTKIKSFAGAKANRVTGEQVFTKNCAICHQLEGKGALVGPQLDGVGGRGLERLCEDILDPNRNVDLAFRTSTVKLKEGKVVTGLFRREEGELVILADNTGKEFQLQKKEIAERRESIYSLMPDNLGEVLTPEDFNNLISFLLSKVPAK